MKILKLTLATLALGLTTQSVLAHHSTKGLYDQTTEVELTGVVKEWRFINPHPSLMLTVMDAKGQAHDWDISYGGSAVTHLSKRGYKADTFKIGEVITVKGRRALVEDAYGLLMERNDPVRADGSPLP